MARTPKTDGATADGATADGAKARRPLGPRKLYVILKPDADRTLVRDAIAEVTFNGRRLLENMGTGDDVGKFLIYKIEVTARNEKDAE